MCVTSIQLYCSALNSRTSSFLNNCDVLTGKSARIPSARRNNAPDQPGRETRHDLYRLAEPLDLEHVVPCPLISTANETRKKGRTGENDVAQQFPRCPQFLPVPFPRIHVLCRTRPATSPSGKQRAHEDAPEVEFHQLHHGFQKPEPTCTNSARGAKRAEQRTYLAHLSAHPPVRFETSPSRLRQKTSSAHAVKRARIVLKNVDAGWGVGWMRAFRWGIGPNRRRHFLHESRIGARCQRQNSRFSSLVRTSRDSDFPRRYPTS